MSILYPFLIDSSQANSNQLFHRPIIKTTSKESTALVAFAFRFDDGQLQFITSQEAKENEYSLEDTEANALQNYAELPAAEWESSFISFEGEEIPVLSRHGDELTATSVLNPYIIDEIQKHFDVKLLTIAIPDQNTVIVCPSSEALASIIREQYTAAENPLSNRVYLSNNGVIVASADAPIVKSSLKLKTPKVTASASPAKKTLGKSIKPAKKTLTKGVGGERKKKKLKVNKSRLK